MKELSFSSFPVIIPLLPRRGTLILVICLFKAINRGTIVKLNVCKPTTVVRIRVRERIVRIRVGETAIGVSVVVRTTNRTEVVCVLLPFYIVIDVCNVFDIYILCYHISCIFNVELMSVEWFLAHSIY